MRFATLFLLLLSLPVLTAHAGVFTYRDELGTLHAVSSTDEIPEKFRQTEKLLGGESGPGEVTIHLEREGEGDSLLIPVSFGGGVTAFLILDTGASVSMISNAIASQTHAPQIGMETIASASQTLTVPKIEMPVVSVGQFSVEKVTMTVNDLPYSGKAKGLLGVNFLNHFKMQLDTKNGLLHLERQ